VVYISFDSEYYAWLTNGVTCGIVPHVLTAVTARTSLFWNEKPCALFLDASISEEPAGSVFREETICRLL